MWDAVDLTAALAVFVLPLIAVGIAIAVVVVDDEVVVVGEAFFGSGGGRRSGVSDGGICEGKSL